MHNNNEQKDPVFDHKLEEGLALVLSIVLEQFYRTFQLSGKEIQC